MIKPHVRAIIAATALAHASGKSVGSIFQYGQGSGWRNISVSISDATVTGFDYSTSAHFSGTIPSLFHYGEGNHVEFKVDSVGKYTGFVYGAGAHFEVTVNGNSASFFDYGGSGWTEFSR